MNLLSYLHDDEGSAVVDFVLIASVLVVLVLGIMQVCFAVHVRNTLASAAAEGAHLNKQLVITTGFVFVTFSIRTVYAFMQALANKLSNLDTLCPGNTVGFCNPECYNMWSHMYVRRLPLRVFVTVWSGTAGSVRRPSLNRPWRSFLHPLRFSLRYGA